MTYQPREFWEGRLRDQFDLRGTGETERSMGYNRACYALREQTLTRALRDAGVTLAGARVLDVGCGTGFFTAYYVAHGAEVTGLDITEVSVERLRARFPQARFLHADVSEAPLDERFDVVNAFDVLYHITDEARWQQALRHLARAVAPGGVLLVTDAFRDLGGAEHNVMRSLERYRAVLEPAGLVPGRSYATHVLLNRPLGFFRFLNRVPPLLYAIDRTLLATGLGDSVPGNRLLVWRRPS